ncbi:hypothetical protein ACFFGV_04140 [Pontibacillus salicampi]|uniref:Uncharacterized protein n=1 Tax=Pontibacillus salicampi TaxID=1449801 RepID=A0ABV6LK53_9BACI
MMCINSPISHDFSFTPSFSFYVTCDTENRSVSNPVSALTVELTNLFV